MWVHHYPYVFLSSSVLYLSCSISSKNHYPFAFADSDEKYRYEIKEILEMEMKILEALDYYLIVFHPYRALSQ